MDNQKRYTAQEMREMSTVMWSEAEYGDYHVTYPRDKFSPNKASDMLRQAADTEDELAQLKARLDTVVKECEKMRDDFSKRMRSFTGMFSANMRSIYEDKIAVVDDILRTARGKGSAPQRA